MPEEEEIEAPVTHRLEPQISSTHRTVSSDHALREHILSQSKLWEWDVFKLEEVSGRKPLMHLAYYLIQRKNFFQIFQIPSGTLKNFLIAIEAGYQMDVPYHNSTHATDVLQAVSYFLEKEKMQGQITDLEILASYIAAAVHDHKHPGVNNQFLVATRNERAMLYNDRSVLENYHVSTAWQVMMQPENNFLVNLPEEDYRLLRNQVISMVLATDLAGHFSTLSAFNNKVLGTNTFDINQSPEDRAIFFRILIKCADVSNPARSWLVYTSWIERLIQEFLNQGDEERKRGLPVSPLMDRSSINIPAGQIGFIDVVCAPMYESFTMVVGAPEMVTSMKKNRAILMRMRDNEIPPLRLGENGRVIQRVRSTIRIAGSTTPPVQPTSSSLLQVSAISVLARPAEDSASKGSTE
ncbi:uncharacterized protein BJ171DRAFT_456693 [Polychytrium aggregatum]|uniref:uncharacterized protein n=1 Tax=Polychytrium aggregatum TaxID=110093 RepID=UPI0022FF12E1|nr:uncharacterized protein BJ171DRAFT_456693 [Polychytrium aggregatum]KAI9206847.1 hypothetical protein BJ171DRAFT_456693 [Polychytrium aggregatum]